MFEPKRLPSFTEIVSFTAAILLPLGLFWGVQAQSPAPSAKQSAAAPTGNAARGELIYVPIYSSIFYENGKSMLDLAATLSIHNVNPDRQISIVRADYFDTTGKLIKKYVEKPLLLSALQTTNIVIDKADKAGGAGANFLVEWQTSQDATSPLVEAVMINASSNLGIAFTTTGKVVRQIPSTAK